MLGKHFWGIWYDKNRRGKRSIVIIVFVVVKR